ncbi:hypothetical protein DFJ58DRAFT_818260 [Suillus subalutaceus]|uniref:uncharacterized protein n=1 Tax=Suillus subalutaceus TaxID=48586 RepID=UPI001B86130C|nr:uncharacterized protein DFJ58DRAFT_818260 [Suillus subalutaceus]KAG1836586.1 hypothetical protein DFJ58DRAFT_818260 [Suillus subalutaceus]
MATALKDSIPVPAPVLKGASAARPTTANSQPRKKEEYDRPCITGNPGISPQVCQVYAKGPSFIMNQDRHHEYDEFSGIRRVEYEELERFHRRDLLTYFNDDTLIIEMPSAVHEAPLVALHTALTCFLQSIPFDRQAINANVMTNIHASDSLVPDMRISLQTCALRSAALSITTPWQKKLQDAIIENPSLSLAIAIVIFENQPYRSPNSDSDTARSLLREPSKRAAEDFVSMAGCHPALNASVIVENHVMVWVRGDDPIDIFSNDLTLVADGVILSFPVICTRLLICKTFITLQPSCLQST